VYGDIVGLIKSQHRKHANAVMQQLASVMYNVNVPFFAPLIGKITSFACNKLAEKLAQSRRPNFPRRCTHTYTLSMGRPCAHKVNAWYTANMAVQPSSFRRHEFYLPDALPELGPTQYRHPLLGRLMSNANQPESFSDDAVNFGWTSAGEQ
jgi:hypothetical protein